jgi:cytochrome c oxidase subunit IV
MGHNYETSKKIALRTIILLAIITVVEVLIALAGKGYLFGGALVMPWYIMNLLMICLSVYKAYKIVFEFMHMGYEVRGLALSVLLPTLLLVWGIIAFLYEGSAWKGNRNNISERNNVETEKSYKPEGMLLQKDTKILQ